FPDSNYGDDALFVGFNATYGAQRSLLWFDIGGEIPDGVGISNASLRLDLNYVNPPDSGPMPIVVRDLQSSWTEQTVTWNTEPIRGDIWDTTDVGSAITTYSWDVTDLVRSWYEGSLENNGLQLEGDEQQAQPRERAFYARETETEFYPRLIVTYGTDVPDVRVDELPLYSRRTFTVSWTNHGPDEGLSHYDLQYRVDGDEWIPWLSEIPAGTTSADFVGEDGRLYEFRARGVQEGGVAEPFGAAEASTTVDTAPPNVTVNSLPVLTNEASFTVSWSGEDEGSGIAYYDVQYRFNGGQWLPWQQQTLATSATFSAMRDGLFEFEARGVDEVGNVEPFSNQPEAGILVDVEPPFIEPAQWLPVNFKQ
ncbi:MAG TPA: DNRLRE domain-containing protein, partial [Candidatus Sulfomarinibacteraceae bacterium]|nr:DNRLRE domain-containing protein [Candidatus Sulfomarinibacteraceae bacterium]